MGLDCVNHHEILKEFSRIYKERAFDMLEEEYEIVKTTICKLMDFSFDNPFLEVVERAMQVAIVETNFVEAIRERFIHPFQNFLLGTIILDNFYDEFSEWFSAELCDTRKYCVDTTWLLASIFHDRVKPLTTIKGLIEFEEGEVEVIVPDEEEYLQKISSLFGHLKTGSPLEDWSDSSFDPNLYSTLKEYSEADNHGVRSSFALLKHLRSAFGESAFQPSFVEAALSIAIHDSKLQSSLLKKDLFPLDIKDFPIPCLLLYCDAIQEWGRKTKYDSETRLVDIEFEDNVVNCEVSFDNHKAARRKLEEIESLKGCIHSTGGIDFNFSPRVHASM